ncbi:hypothetical protein OVS_01410 [Mycoplasma ovis str. Michigan]|uniref:Uncharacterized protein n=1 Tax=Mycoplasma ovis str. Michigan TaxID=1415773 RepID=A0ABM5P150_9MOLU|nr:hypothetical protein OVS_01410 [Mycoplasma ovis str. Michigan]
MQSFLKHKELLEQKQIIVSEVKVQFSKKLKKLRV